VAILLDKDGNEVEVSSKEELAAELDKSVSKHLTGALRNQLPKLLASDEVSSAMIAKLGIDEKLSTFGEGLLEKLKTEVPKPPPGDGKGTPEPPKVEDSPAFKAMLQKQEALQKQLDAEKAAKVAERDKARKQTLRQKSLEALAEHGITGKRAQIALNNLLAEGKVKFESDDSDELLFVDSKGDELPLADGTKSWVESDEDAKMFLPPRGASGSGDDPRRSAGIKQKQDPFSFDPRAIGEALRNLTTGE
jgi:hypothetical protein